MAKNHIIRSLPVLFGSKIENFSILSLIFNRISKIVAAALCACFLIGCSYPPPGAASLTIVSNQTERMGQHYSAMGAPVQDKDCLTIGPFFMIWFGKNPIEEVLLAKILEENSADVLLDAEFKRSNVMIPYLFMRSCVTIYGTPAKLRGAR